MEKRPPVEVVKNLLQNKTCSLCNFRDKCSLKSKDNWNTCKKWEKDSLDEYIEKMSSLANNISKGGPTQIWASETVYKILEQLIRLKNKGDKNESNNGSK